MPDATLPRQPPRDWNAAFAGLPLERPAADGWASVAAALRPSHRRQAPLWLAAAAALLLAAVLPWRSSLGPGPGATAVPDDKVAGPVDPLAALHAESAQLETLLELASDNHAASGAAAVLGGQLEARVALIDGTLREPGLSRTGQLSLWRQRVDTLRAAAAFQSNDRWLTAQGDRYDGALVQID